VVLSFIENKLAGLLDEQLNLLKQGSTVL